MKKRLSGGYIQLWADDRLNNDEVWRKVIHEMKLFRMDTLIIQFMDTMDTIKLCQDLCIASIILKHAQENDINVFLGLYEGPAETGSQASITSNNLNKSKEESIRVAKVLKKRFGSPQEFYGWHIPLESWTGNYSDTEIRDLNGYYTTLTSELKALLPDKKVLVSPYINAKKFGRTTPQITRTVYTEILQDTGIDFLALQDGVGAGYISVDDPDLPKYVAAMCDACTANDIEMWMNVESFTALAPKINTAADPARFIRQLEPAQGGSRIITFDFFHYMNTGYILEGTSRPDGYPDAVEMLNAKYSAWLQAGETILTDGPCR